MVIIVILACVLTSVYIIAGVKWIKCGQEQKNQKGCD